LALETFDGKNNRKQSRETVRGRPVHFLNSKLLFSKLSNVFGENGCKICAKKIAKFTNIWIEMFAIFNFQYFSLNSRFRENQKVHFRPNTSYCFVVIGNGSVGISAHFATELTVMFGTAVILSIAKARVRWRRIFHGLSQKREWPKLVNLTFEGSLSNIYRQE
jgi:hypothetical protein